MIRFDLGELKNVWIQITDRDEGVISVTSPTFEVFDEDGSSVQGSASATVEDNGTATVKIYGLVDTSSGFTAGENYEVKFTYTISSETYIDLVHIKIVETRI